MFAGTKAILLFLVITLFCGNATLFGMKRKDEECSKPAYKRERIASLVYLRNWAYLYEQHGLAPFYKQAHEITKDKFPMLQKDNFYFLKAEDIKCAWWNILYCPGQFDENKLADIMHEAKQFFKETPHTWLVNEDESDRLYPHIKEFYQLDTTSPWSALHAFVSETNTQMDEVKDVCIKTVTREEDLQNWITIILNDPNFKNDFHEELFHTYKILINEKTKPGLLLAWHNGKPVAAINAHYFETENLLAIYFLSALPDYSDASIRTLLVQQCIKEIKDDFTYADVVYLGTDKEFSSIFKDLGFKVIANKVMYTSKK